MSNMNYTFCGVFLFQVRILLEYRLYGREYLLNDDFNLQEIWSNHFFTNMDPNKPPSGKQVRLCEILSNDMQMQHCVLLKTSLYQLNINLPP